MILGGKGGAKEDFYAHLCTFSPLNGVSKINIRSDGPV